MRQRFGYHHIFLFSLLLSNPLWAKVILSNNFISCCDTPKYPKPYIELGISQASHQQFSHDNHQFTLFSDGTIEKTLSIRPTHHSTLPNFFTLGVGSQWTRDHSLSPFPAWSVGLRYQYGSTNRAKQWLNFSLDSQQEGEIQPLIKTFLPVSLIQHTITSDVKLNLYRLDTFSPYVNFGLGVSWKRIPGQAFWLNQPTHLPAQENTSNWQNSSLSYHLGAGLDFLISRVWALTLGYQYDNFGSIEVGAPVLSPQTQSSFFPKGIKLSNFYLGKLMTHSLQLSGRYFFG